METTQAVVSMTDAEIDAWLEESRKDDSPPDPAAVSAEYNRDFDMVVIKLDTGDRLLIPREKMEGLEDASYEQLAHIEIFGDDIAWSDLDVDHYLPNLIEGKYASERWKQARKQQLTATAA